MLDKFTEGTENYRKLLADALTVAIDNNHVIKRDYYLRDGHITSLPLETGFYFCMKCGRRFNISKGKLVYGLYFNQPCPKSCNI